MHSPCVYCSTPSSSSNQSSWNTFCHVSFSNHANSAASQSASGFQIYNEQLDITCDKRRARNDNSPKVQQGIKQETQTEASYENCFISMLDDTNTPLPPKLRKNGTQFNVDKMKSTRSYDFDNCMDLGMEALRKSLFGTDENKDAEKVQREKDRFTEKVALWYAKTMKKNGREGYNSMQKLTVDLAEVLDGVQDLKPEQRLPGMSMIRNVKGISRKVASTALGATISKHEWTRANKHIKKVGKGRSTCKRQFSRLCIPTQELEVIMRIMDNPKYTQRLAFGVTLMQLADDTIVTLDKVQTNALNKIIEDYVRALVDEINDGLIDLPQNRCKATHQSFGSLQCIREEGHNGSHRYTPKGKMSPETVKKFIASLTAGE